MKMTRIKFDDSNENDTNNNHNGINISIIHIQMLTVFDISDECMDKLEYDVNSIMWTVELELLKYMGSHMLILL